MKVDKMSISMDPQLGDDARAAARLRNQALADFLSDWQAKHGTITAAELAAARTELGHASQAQDPGHP